ncbi:MAG: hypothetical protein AB7T06_32875 [Kofleriaceae bacterium]
MPIHVETDVSVQRFAFTQDEGGRRLTFPRAETKRIEGRAGAVAYGAEDCAFDNLVGRLDMLRWVSDQTSIGSAWLRDDNGRFDIAVASLEMPDGVMLTRATQGIEIVSPTASMSDMKLSLRGPFGRGGEQRPAPPSPEPRELRQDSLHFLDSLSGRIYLTIKVVLDLPVIGKRTLDQKLKVPIQEGKLNYRALEESLDWLEGTFLDIEHDRNTLALQWKVPIVGSARDLVKWQLDAAASNDAALGHVPVRSLADFRTAGSNKPAQKPDNGKSILKSLSLEGLDLALSLLAPRSLEVGGGLIMFGGEDQPGMVDLKVTGGINDRGPGTLKGAIGSVDTTIKDLHLGPVRLTADRLHFDGLDQLVVTFEAFRPVKIDVLIRKVTATNLALAIGGAR